MYKGHKVRVLMRERGVTAKELLDHLGVKDNGTIARFTGTDIKASRLEQIADFFGVSIDYFFDREGDVNISFDGALATRGGKAEYYASARSRELAERIKSLESQLEVKNAALADKELIINEKEERIKLLEKLLKTYER